MDALQGLSVEFVHCNANGECLACGKPWPCSRATLGALEPLTLYCGCGAYFEGPIHRGPRARFVAAWHDVHRGPGHGETDERGAWMAQRHQQAIAEDRCRAVGGAS